MILTTFVGCLLFGLVSPDSSVRSHQSEVISPKSEADWMSLALKYIGLRTADFGLRTDESGLFQSETGRIQFKSMAPLEVIQAQSNKLRGAIDPANQSFAWSVDIKTFDGFNSPLQREHFNESYLESNSYPKAVFTGKIIEKIDYGSDGVYTVRAKGKLSIHGVAQERIIKSQLEVKGKTLHIQSTFTVALTDHNIAIPKIVHQKIAETVTVTVQAELPWKE